MKKDDILKGKFNKKLIDSLTTEQKSDWIYTLHDPKQFPKPLKDVDDVGAKNIVKFLKLCITTNTDNVEWYLLHIID